MHYTQSDSVAVASTRALDHSGLCVEVPERSTSLGGVELMLQNLHRRITSER